MMKKFLLSIISLTVLLVSCNKETGGMHSQNKPAVTITSTLDPFVGEESTKVNVAGTDFIDGDLIRLKIICPFVSTTERGEYTDGNSYDSFYLLKRSGKSWIRVLQADKFDISGTFSYSDSPNIASYYEAQQTPYVYVATTWSEERRFMASSDDKGNLSLYDHMTPVFHADQSKEKHYRASDVLWAQTFMQTGAWNIHLGFQHKMACLDIMIDDTNLTAPNPDFDPQDPESSPTIHVEISSDALLTLEGMPDIDQAEIVVGDYYADASKSNHGYGYKQKSSCSYANNGKVLGVAVNDETARRAKVAPLTGSPIPGGGDSNYERLPFVPNTATYTAYKLEAKHYRLIVPPFVLAADDASDEAKEEAKAVFWLRDGSRRFNVALDQLSFAEGVLYNIKLKLGVEPEPEPEPDPDPDPDPEEDPEITE